MRRLARAARELGSWVEDELHMRATELDREADALDAFGAASGPADPPLEEGTPEMQHPSEMSFEEAWIYGSELRRRDELMAAVSNKHPWSDRGPHD